MTATQQATQTYRFSTLLLLILGWVQMVVSMEKKIDIESSYPPPVIPPPSPNGVTARIESCRDGFNCILHNLEDLRSFLHNGEAEKYYGVTLEWKYTFPTMHVFYNGTLHETIDLSEYDEARKLHKVFRKAGLLHMPDNAWMRFLEQKRQRQKALNKVMAKRLVKELPPHHKFNKDEITNRVLRLQGMKGASAIAFNEHRREQKLLQKQQQKEQELAEWYRMNEEKRQLWIYSLVGFFFVSGMILTMAITAVKSRRRQTKRGMFIS